MFIVHCVRGGKIGQNDQKNFFLFFQHILSNFFSGSQDRKKHRKISETAVLPTIPDEQNQEPPEPHKDAETESELEEDAVSYT